MAHGLVDLHRTRIPRGEWDRFAARCGASHWGTAGGIPLWQWKHHVPLRTVRFEILLGCGPRRVKAGQCAVGLGARRRVFGEGLQLLPQHADLWPLAMAAVLCALGPGLYTYGSDHSFELPRETELRDLAGVSVEAVDRYVVEAVDFSRWPTWEAFLRALSANVRRNVRHADACSDGLACSEYRGLATMLHIPPMSACRAAMYRRKGIRFSVAHMAGTYAARATLLRGHAMSMAIWSGVRALATFGGVAFGSSLYYLDGGSRAGSNGAAWAMLLRLMRRHQQNNPRGRFVMGSSRCEDYPGADWTSEVRHRRDCRVAGFPTSVVTFTYGDRANGGDVSAPGIRERIGRAHKPC